MLLPHIRPFGAPRNQGMIAPGNHGYCKIRCAEHHSQGEGFRRGHDPALRMGMRIATTSLRTGFAMTLRLHLALCILHSFTPHIRHGFAVPPSPQGEGSWRRGHAPALRVRWGIRHSAFGIVMPVLFSGQLRYGWAGTIGSPIGRCPAFGRCSAGGTPVRSHRSSNRRRTEPPDIRPFRER